MILPSKKDVFALSIAFTLASTTAVAAMKLVKNEDAELEITSLCLSNILNHYFHEAKKLSLRYDSDERYHLVVTQILQRSGIPAILNVDEEHAGIKVDKRPPSDVVLIFGNTGNLTAYLKNTVFTAVSVFFVVSPVAPDGTLDIFRAFRQFNALNAFVLYVDANGVHVYESGPDRNCSVGEAILSDYRPAMNIRRGEPPRLITRRPPMRRFNGCTFTVTTVDIPPTVIFPEGSSRRGTDKIEGIEGWLFPTIAERIDAKFRYKIADDGVKWGFIYPQPLGGVGEVFTGKSDVASGSPSPILERVVNLECVVGASSTTECISWFVPAGLGRNRPVWLGIFLSEFSVEMWISMAVVLAVMVASFCLATRVVGVETAPSAVDVSLLLLSSAFGATVRIRKTWTSRALLASWFFYGLVISSAYESSLRSKLTIPLRNKDINTYRELVESNLDLLGISTTIRVLYKDRGDPIIEAIGRRAVASNTSIEKVVARMTRDRNVAYMREYTTFVYAAYKDRRVMGRIHKLPQCALEFVPSVYLKRRSILEPVFKDILGHLFQSGIFQFWRSLYLKESPKQQASVVRLTVEHMTAPLIAYGVGIILGVAAFAAECLRLNRARLGS